MNLIPRKEKHAKKGLSFHVYTLGCRNRSQLTASHLPSMTPDWGRNPERGLLFGTAAWAFQKKTASPESSCNFNIYSAVRKQPWADGEREPDQLMEGQVQVLPLCHKRSKGLWSGSELRRDQGLQLKGRDTTAPSRLGPGGQWVAGPWGALGFRHL